MRQLHSLLLVAALALLQGTAYAQCPNGQPSGTTAYDHSVSFGDGVTATQVKFPKLDPQAFMISCVRLTITLVGVADSVGMQNLVTNASQNGTFRYYREDEMTGPGLLSPLQNIHNGSIGPQNLAPYDGVSGAGPDFHSIVDDTVLMISRTRTITDPAEILQFYGSDSLVYDYNLMIFSWVQFTGGANQSSVRTSAAVNFRMEYCTCPIASLPLGLENFSLVKTGNATADLRWDGEADNHNYTYDVEYSRDGKKFTKAGTVVKKYNVHNPQYQYAFAVQGNNYGRYYFRVKQRWANGWYQYTDVKAVEFVNPMFSTVSLYPNPSSGIVGLKFVNAKAGRFAVEVSNVQGQLVMTKEITVAATDYKVVATLQRGFYYVKLTDKATGASCTNEMLIQ